MRNCFASTTMLVVFLVAVAGVMSLVVGTTAGQAPAQRGQAPATPVAAPRGQSPAAAAPVARGQAAATRGQAAAPAPVRTIDGKPNLTGLWQAIGTANWDIQDHSAKAGPFFQLGAIGAIPGGQGIVEGNEIPYQPWALAKKKENGANCYVAIMQEMVHEARIIPLNGGPHASDKIRSYMGDSRGRWEGNTLVVDTTNFLPGKTGIGANGGGTPTSDALHLIERFTRTDKDTVKYEVTIDDPKTFVRPWTVSFPLYQEPGYELKGVEWMIEGAAPNALLRRGWTKESLLAGTEINVEGFQAKDGTNKANGSVITFNDGKKLFVGSSNTGAPEYKEETKK